MFHVYRITNASLVEGTEHLSLQYFIYTYIYVCFLMLIRICIAYIQIICIYNIFIHMKFRKNTETKIIKYI